MSHLDHRGGWSLLVERFRPDPTLLQRLGGESVVGQVIEGLYDRIEADPVLLPLFRHDLTLERATQKRFFTRWLGGDLPFEGYRSLRSRHRGKVSRDGAQRWLGHFSAALKQVEVSADLRRELMEVLVPLANALIDDQPMLLCQEWYRKPAADVAKGKLSVFQDWVDQHPELLEPGPAQLMMHQAARRGHLEIVDFLLDSGVDVNLPNCSDTEVAITPYCAARWGRHQEVAERLLERGAVVDIFTLTWLGELPALEQMLSRHPELLDVDDPAQDFLEVRPLEHAVLRGKVPTVEFLLEKGADLSHRGEAFVDWAVGKKKTALVRCLLEAGAGVSRVGPGRWLTVPDLRELLFSKGVDLANCGADWVEFCTGHHGNRENPELIRRLLELGVDLEARANKGRTALHCATRVGYCEVIKVLLEAGADVEARDCEGNTPLHYVLQARPTVDREATARVLLEGGADPEARNDRGESPRELGIC